MEKKQAILKPINERKSNRAIGQLLSLVNTIICNILKIKSNKLLMSGAIVIEQVTQGKQEQLLIESL